jgi:isopenicillin-N epimerase
MLAYFFSILDFHSFSFQMSHLQRLRRVALRALADSPSCTPESIAADFCSNFNEKTKVVFFSHITSVTALTLPAKLICAEARKRGIISVVDGAHALGQIDLDMQEIGAGAQEKKEKEARLTEEPRLLRWKLP